MDSTPNRQAWESYVEGLTSADEQKRKVLLGKTIAENCLYTGPAGQVRGLADLEVTFTGFREEYPNARFQTLRFLEHSGRALVDWNVIDQQNEILVSGTTFAIWNDDGRIDDMTGFYYTRE